MKKETKKIIRISVVVLSLFISLSFAYSSNDNTNENYTTLTTIPIEGCTEKTCPTDMSKYLPSAFNFVVGLAVVLAFIMLSYGGFLYATSDAIQGKSEGKGKIENALWGLLLVIGAYTILYTINPKMLDFSLLMERPSIDLTGMPTVTFGVPMDAKAVEESLANKDWLQSQGVDTQSGPCAQGQTKGCVNLNLLPDSATNGLADLKKSCGSSCSIVITGGTEGGHASHGQNLPNVDIVGNTQLNNHVAGSKPLVPCQKYPSGNGTYMWEPKGSTCGGSVPSSGDHWHVTYK